MLSVTTFRPLFKTVKNATKGVVVGFLCHNTPHFVQGIMALSIKIEERGGCTPSFGAFGSSISPAFFCALRAPFFIALFGFGQTYQIAIHQFQNRPFFHQAHWLTFQTAIPLFRPSQFSLFPSSQRVDPHFQNLRF